MMEWTLSILFGGAVLLLILSFMKAKQEAKIEKSEIEQFSISMMEEMQQLEQKMRYLELDHEITAKEAGIKVEASAQRAILREAIDLHRRGYSLEGIAAKTRKTESEIKLMLAPYMELPSERRKAANDL
ncbi:hypothetical protein [Halalkalibacter alkalisediminis]|uniref:DUF2802 domain-containing protein n=1 Tax=Halalkalibacter alkalisediminis TaxID=935616 RepID=A0ABV6NJS2_9BACI|nr:hypothetical protein [Halalkalibacter alkalisediminis]